MNRSAWGLKLAGIFFIRLVLDAWSLVLGAWHFRPSRPGFLVLDAWRLELDAWSSAVPAGELEACRLKLGAWRLQLGAWSLELLTLGPEGRIIFRVPEFH